MDGKTTIKYLRSYNALALANCYDIEIESVIKEKENINNTKYNSGIVFEENR